MSKFKIKQNALFRRVIHRQATFNIYALSVVWVPMSFYSVEHLSLKHCWLAYLANAFLSTI